MTQPLYVSDPEKWLRQEARMDIQPEGDEQPGDDEGIDTVAVEATDENGEEILCIVVFLGAWSKTDKYYLQSLGDYITLQVKNEQLRSLSSPPSSRLQHPILSVKLIAWTSEGPAGAKRAIDEWKLTSEHGFTQVIGDETNALAKYLVNDELLPKLQTVPLEEYLSARRKDDNEDEIGDGPPSSSTYPNGMVLPGQIWFARRGVVVEQWEFEKESSPNSFGGKNSGRPCPVSIWNELQKRVASLRSGNAVMPHHDNPHRVLIATATDEKYQLAMRKKQ
jgi:hypothetical protein